MNMKMIETKTHYVFDLGNENISSDNVKLIDELLKKTSKLKSFAIDMEHVTSCCNEFFDLLQKNSKKRKITLVNTPSEILVLLNLTRTDDSVDLFQSEIDMEEDKRSLVNRKFAIIN